MLTTGFKLFLPITKKKNTYIHQIQLLGIGSIQNSSKNKKL